MAALRRTPLHGEHLALGARLVEFGGWEMPVHYRGGILAEHRAVREAAGLFDVSHMGEIAIRGPGALAAVQAAVTNDAARLAVDQALYSPMCYPDGGTVDDLLVYRTAPDAYLLVVNAATAEHDLRWLSAGCRAAADGAAAADPERVAADGSAAHGSAADGAAGADPEQAASAGEGAAAATVGGTQAARTPDRTTTADRTGRSAPVPAAAGSPPATAMRAAAGFPAEIAEESDRHALLALQGPLACEVLARLCDPPAAAALVTLAPFRLLPDVRVAGCRCAVSRTGYTGEDGFELLCDPDDAVALWRSVLAGGPVTPCGLGARDVLRLEAGLPLYGHELAPDVSPLEAGLRRFVKFDKGRFCGRDALLRQSEAGVARRLCGLVLGERAIARAGSSVLPDGRVTSGTFSPSLGRPIALALVPPADAVPGGRLAVEIRGRAVPADVAGLPFYRRPARRR